MENLIKKIELIEDIEYIGPIDELKTKLNESANRNFNVEWVSDVKFKISSKWSFGTMTSTNTDGGINGYGVIGLPSGEDSVNIHLMTKIRRELYLVFGIAIFFAFVMILQEEKPPIWTYFMFPVSLFWFWAIYRYQENELFKKVKEHLRNN